MKTLEIDIPEKLDKIPKVERERILNRAIDLSLKMRREELMEEVQKSHSKIVGFEKKYGTDFTQFEKSFPPDATREMHEDYVEWYYWDHVTRTSCQLLDDLYPGWSESDEG